MYGALDLQEKLKNFLEEKISGYWSKKEYSEEVCPIKIFEQQAPLLESNQETSMFPYVAVIIEKEYVENDDFKAKILFEVGVSDDSEECIGHKDVWTILNKIQTCLLDEEIIDGRYTMDIFNMEKSLQNQATYPKYYGWLKTLWSLPPIIRKENFL